MVSSELVVLANTDTLTARQRRLKAARRVRNTPSRLQKAVVDALEPRTMMSATHLAFAIQPADTTAGEPLSSVTVSVLDGNDAIVTSSSALVTFSLSTSPNGADPLFFAVPAVNGVATLSGLSFTLAGNYALQATATGLVADVSDAFAITPDAAAYLDFTASPSNMQAGGLGNITVAVKDQYGNTVTSDTSNITINLASGSGSLLGTTTVAAVNGVATFNDLGIHVPGDFTLGASAGGLDGDTTGSFTVTPDDASQLDFTTQPANGGPGGLSTIVVTVKDQFGNTVTTDTSEVTLAIASGSGILGGTTTVNAVAGVATFSNLNITTADSYTLSASDGSLTGDTSASFTISPGAATALMITQETSDAVAGTTLSTLNVAIVDGYGNVVTSDTSNVTISIYSGSGSLLGTTTVAAVNGVAAFSNLSLTSSGTFSFEVISGSLESAVSDSITISPDSASQLTISQQPTTTPAGETISSIVVRVEDQYGNLVTTDSSNVTIAINTGTGTLLGTTTVAAVNGVATFSTLSIAETGSFTLTVSDGSLTTDVTSSFTIGAAPAHHLTITQQATNTVAGQTISSIVVEVRDQYDNVVTTDTSEVTIAIASGDGTLLGTTTLNAVAGIATFSTLSIQRTGSFTLSVTDGSLTADTGSSFSITPDEVHHLTFTSQPTTSVAGVTLSNIVVHVRDQYDNVVTTDGSDITISVATGSGALSGTDTVTAVNGVATFSGLSITTADSYTFDVTNGTVSGSSSTLTITPDAATHLTITQQATNTVAGETISTLIVEIRDQYENVVTSNSSSIIGIDISSGTGSLDGTVYVEAVNGVATFSDLSITTAGTKALGITANGLTGANGNNFNITPAAASQLVITTQPSNTTAGQTIGDVIAEIRDQYGNVVDTDSGNVTISLGSGSGSLAGTTTVAAVNGVVTFSGLSITAAGAKTLDVSMGNLTTDTSSSFNITADAAAQLAITTPADGVVGSLGTVLVTVQDQYGNTVTTDTSTVSLAIDFGTGNLLGTASVAAVNGVATFTTLAIHEAGSFTLSASDGSLTGVTTNLFELSPDAPAQLYVDMHPSNAFANNTFTAQVFVQDQYGNLVVTDTSAITVALNGNTGATLNGTVTVNAVNGQVLFNNLSMTKAGDYTLHFTTGSLTAADSNQFSILPAGADHLSISVGPATTVAGQTIAGISVQVLDVFGNVAVSDNGDVAIVISSGPGSFASGTATVSASSGLVTFSDLQINVAGTYTISVIHDGITGATSSTFTITPAAASKVVFTAPPASGIAGDINTIVAQVQDQYDNVVTTDTSAVTISVASGSGALLGTTTVNAVAGIANFFGLAIHTADTYTLSVSDGSLTSDTSASFTITAAAASKLVITQDPTTTVAGQTISNIVVEVRDEFDNVVTTDSSNVTITLDTGTGTISGTTTVAAVNGVATFSGLSMVVAGDKTFTVSVNGLSSDTTASTTISPDAADHLAIVSQPSSGNAGDLNDVVVHVLDQYGNVVTGDTSSVTIAIGSGSGSLLGTTTVNAVAGIATFSTLAIQTPDTYTLDVTDGSLTGATSTSFTITPDVASQLDFTTQPGNISAGALGTVVVKVKDQFGNVVTTDSSTVTLSISGNGALLGTFEVAAVNGVATFNAVTIHTAGTFTLTASDGSLTQDTSSSFTVSPTSATQLAFTSQPTSMVAGNLLTGIQVSIQDQYGNVVNSNQNITFNVTGGGSTFNFVIAAVNGVATLNSIYLVKAGDYGVRATRSGLTTAYSDIITVTPDVATKLVVTTGPSNTVAGQNISSIVVKVQDQFDNVVTTDSSNVTLSLTSGTGTLGGTTTVAAVNGVATFSDLNIVTTGSYTLEATDGSLTAGTASSFTVTPAAASQLVITTDPTNTVAGQTISNIVAKVQDQYGNVVTTDSSNVTIAINSGVGTLNGTTTVTAVSGVATFSTLNITTTGSFTLTVTDGSLTSDTTTSFNITPAAAHHVAFTTQPASGAAGDLNTIVVQVQDQYNNVVTTDTSSVEIAIASGTGTLLGTTTINAVAGVATFSTLGIHTPDTFTLSATDGALTSDTSDSFTITHAAATELVITQDTSDAVAGQTLSTIIVELRDQYGNVATSDTSNVTISIASGTATLNGTLTVAAVNGVATFSTLNITKSGAYTLAVESGNLTSDTTASFTVSNAAASKLSFASQPATTVAGQTMSSIVIEVRDQYDNVVVTDTSDITISVASGGGTLLGTTTVTAVNGVATFSTLSMTSSGTYTLLVTDGVQFQATSTSFVITPDAAHHLSFTTQPSNATAGGSFGAVAKVLDQYGNVVTTDTSAVTISIASGTGTLAGTTTVNAVAGVATFSGLSIQTAGSFTLSVADGSLTGATSNSFTISPSTATQLVFSQQPQSATAGAQLATINVAVQDQYGNVVTGSNASINLSINSGGNNVSLIVAATNGVSSFTGIALTRTGTFTFRATSTGLTQATSSNFTISPDAASKLAFSTQPSNGQAGALSNIVVQVQDQYDNVVTTDTSTVTIALNGTAGALLGTTSVAAVNGVATFSALAMHTPGTFTLSVTDGSLTGATSNSYTISAAAASQVVFSTQPTNTVAGQTISTIVAQVKDQYGNIVTTDSSNVTIALNGTAGTLNGTKTVAAVNGVATFTGLSLNTAGSYTIRVTDGSLTGDTSSSFTITPAAASQLVLTSQPTTTVAGQTISTITAQVQDQYGNVVTTDSSNVTIAVSSGTGTLSGTTTVSAVNGVATFSGLSIAKTGSYTLTVTDGSLTAATTSSFTVTPAAATHLAFTSQPSQGNAGSLGTVTVSVLDTYDNVVTTDTSAVTIALGSGSGTLSGTTTVNAVAGVATFSNLSISTAGTYTLSATDGSLTAATSDSFTLTYGTPTTLVITQQPTNTVAGETISTILVSVRDQYGNVVTTDSSTVTIAIASGNGILGGTTTAVVSNGIATFSSLNITTAGAYTLSVTDGSLTADTTASFTITADVANHLSITTQPSDAVAGGSISVVAKVVDQYGNTVTTDTSEVTIALASGPETTLNGTTTVTAVNGVATFSGLSINKNGQFTLALSDGSLSGATTESFTISPNAATRLTITQQLEAVIAGQTMSTIAVTVEDQYGNQVTSNFSEITITLNGTDGSLSGTTTVMADGGIVAFSDLSMTKAGTYTFTVTSGDLTHAVSQSFTVMPDAAHHISLSYPTTIVAGEAIDSVVATILDQYNNVLTDSEAAVTIEFTDADTLTGDTTVNAINGIATFGDLAITRAGTYSFTVTGGDVSNTGSPSITVVHGDPALVMFTTGPSDTVAGQSISTITAKIADQYGNVISEATDIVTIAISSGEGTLLGTQTASAVDGVVTFSNLSIQRAGEYTLSVSTGELEDGVSDSFVITPDAPAKLVITQQPGTQGANTLSDLIVEVQDQYGNLVTDDSSSVTVAIASGGGTLNGTKTVAAEGGIATFSDLSVSKNGTFTLRVTDGSLTNDTTDPFVIGAKLVFQKQPTQTVAGATIGGTNGIKILIQDASGKLLTTLNSEITLSIFTGPEGSELGGTVTVEAVNGIATFSDLNITTSGAYKLTATNDELNTGTSATFNIVAAAPATMEIIQDATDTVAGVKMGAVKVRMLDEYGNITTNNKQPITMTIANGPEGGAITGTFKSTPVNGIATFSNLVLKKAGTYTLTATGAGVTIDTSEFTVTAAAAKKLAFVQQPTGTSIGNPLSPEVTVQVTDAFGNLIENSTASITLALSSGPKGSLTPITVVAENGVATFSSVSFTKKGTHKLKATSTGLTLATSTTFIITPLVANPA